ncbi:hypothetical protein ACFLRX_01445 [Acidobacteriota bacterium]
MPWTVYAILIVFGVFVILIIIDPRLSCFGRKIRSPFYPIMRKKNKRPLQTEDYGFSLVDEDMKLDHPTSIKDHKNVQQDKTAGRMRKKELKTVDYGFHLNEETNKQDGGDSD